MAGKRGALTARVVCAAAFISFFATARAQSTAPIRPARISGDVFRSLRWIEGTWRGLDGSSKAFYEAYTIVDDSTISMRQYSDSAFRRVTPDSMVIELRNGIVTSRGSSGVVSTAIEMTAASVTFVRPGNTVRFTFARDSTDQWSARIHLAEAGAADITYVMRRVAPVR